MTILHSSDLSNKQQEAANTNVAIDVTKLFFECKSFDELTAAELHALYALRQQVFVVEQNCPYNDIDELDLCSWHLFSLDENGRALATCRLISAGKKYVEATIGRVVTAPIVRASGVGRALMQQAIEQLATFGFKAIRIGAQQRLQKFYESFGFVCVSAPYMEDGIAHVEMLKT